MYFEGLIRDVKGLQAEVKTRDELTNIVKERVKDGMNVLAKACKPICVAAAGDYNESTDGSLHIVLDDISMCLDLENLTISLYFWMRDTGGYEPDEEFSGDDVKRIESKVRSILNKKLKDARLPFTLSEISVPTQYYMK